MSTPTLARPAPQEPFGAPSAPSSAAAALGGVLRLRLDLAPPHNLQSSRQDWLARLAPGRPAAQLPPLAGQLFSLCGQAQRLCAHLALQAALGQAASATPAEARGLRDETLREHLRRLLLDWPVQLGPLAVPNAPDAAEAAAALASCPLFGRAAPHADPGAAKAEAALGPWLERLLGLPAADWLAGWEAAPAPWAREWAREWAAHGQGWLARLLQGARAHIDQPLPACPPLPWPGDAGLRSLARALGETSGLSSRPLWQGGCAETGPWSRHHQADARVFDTPWLRLLARLAEAVRLALPEAPDRCGSAWLATAALRPTGPDAVGVAAVEMARGLLLHRVRLSAADAAAPVLDCQVLAPTEWNFHPQGSVAQALAALGPAASPQAVPALMCAYDPCVTYETTLEPQHHA